MNEVIKVLFLVGGTPGRGLTPSSRFRVYSYSKLFSQDRRFEIRIRPSIPSIAFHERVFFKRHKWLGKFLIFPAILVMISVRLADVCRAAFYDVVVIQKPLLPGKIYPFLELLIAWVNPRTIFDFDDAKFIYHESTSKERNNWIYHLIEDQRNVERIILRSALVTPGNSYLASYASKFCKNVQVVPTPIDIHAFVPREDRQPNISKESAASQPIVIGWIGTSGNLRYVESLAPVLRRIQSTHCVELRIVCNPISRSLALEGVRWQWVDWSLEGELAELHRFTIGIMPLENSVWERGKCGFKLLQYMACGIPVVGSPVGVNCDIIRDGENGFLADSLSSWESKLERLIEDTKLRREFAIAGRKSVTAGFSIECVYPVLAESIVSVYRGNAPSVLSSSDVG